MYHPEGKPMANPGDIPTRTFMGISMLCLAAA